MMAGDGAPLVSIIIAAFNAEDTIERAVRSALNQTVPVEVVVIDDYSQDRTWEIVKEIATGDRRLIAHRQEVNGGPAQARNRGLDLVSSAWVTPLDSDDFMSEQRIERLLELAEADGWDFVADDIFKVLEEAVDRPLYRLWLQSDFGVKRIDLETFVRGNISAKHEHRRELGFVKPLIRRDFLQKHELRYDPQMRLGEDYDLYARAIALGARFCLVDPCGYYAVEREGSLSGACNAWARGGLVMADRRLIAMPGLNSTERAAIRDHMRESYREWAWMRLIDAVKARDIAEVVRCFVAPPDVILSLMGRLGWQAWVRGFRLLRI